MASRNIEIVIAARDNFTGTANKVIGSLNKMDRAAGRVGKGVGQMATGFARAGVVIGAAAVTGLAAAAKVAIDFEDAFAGVRKTVDEADLAKAGLTFESLARQFRDMATEIPVAATELAAIGETAGALGIRAQDIEEFTRTVALLGVTTNLSTAEAAESLGKVGTILNLTGKEFENFADILVNLGNKGASTEAEIIEITKRFAASGRQAGLSIPQILAYASAIASAGAEPEAAGSSLSRLFGNLITETARATAKGKAFAEVTGKSFKDFSKIVEKDTNGAMIAFLQSLNKLDKFGQQKALKAVGITNVRDRNAILLLAGTIETNLIPAFKNAEDSAGALSEEARKRFDVLKAQIQLFKNNLIEAGITVGEGMLPAIKRATEKLTAFLQLPSTQKDLKQLGEDVGKAIDSVNWEQVLSGARTFASILKDSVGYAKTIFDWVNKLPTEIKAAGLGFLALNKVSGGLIGAGAANIVGGLGELGIRSVGSRLPGAAGRLFAQPVFVTNWAMMAGGGLGGALGNITSKGGLLGLLGKVFPLTFVAGLELAIAEAIGPPLRDFFKVPENGTGAAPTDLPFGFQNRVGVSSSANAPSRQENQSGGRSAGGSFAPPLGPPAPPGMGQTFGPPSPVFEDDPRLAGIIERAEKAGRKPLDLYAAAMATLTRNIIREASFFKGAKSDGAAKTIIDGKEVFGPPKPVFEDDPRLAGIIKRAKDAGRQPIDLYASAMGTLQRTIARDQQRAIDSVRAEAARTTAAAQRTAFAIEHKADVPIVIPAPKVTLNNYVSATGVTHTTIQVRRYGPTGGSREISEGGGHGPLI